MSKTAKQLNNRRGRVIIRNLPFNSTKEGIQEHFSQYGEIEDVNIPQKNGKNSGFAFLQYSRTNDAVKAIKESSGQKFMNRLVALDWAIPKDTYVKAIKPEKEEKIKIEEDDECNEDDEKMEEDSDNDAAEPEIPENKKKIKTENDVSEKRTIFIRNIPYEANDDDLKQAFSHFGSIEYARIVRRPQTNISAGTGFIKFAKVECADICLQNTEHRIMDQIVYPHLALSRDDVKNKVAKKSEQKTCVRNLYLLKEGLILSGSAAAEDVSINDMTLRNQLEKTRNEQIKNLGTLVSQTRLTIHNLPLTWDSQKLRAMIIRESRTRPIESRVMLSNKTTAEFPKGVSKGYGYIAFKKHEDALQCLRLLNNNPNVFGKNKRPIVAFSIENIRALELKQRRLEGSKPKLNKSEKRKLKIANNKSNDAPKKPNIQTPYTGMTADPSSKSNVRSNRKINDGYRQHVVKRLQNKSAQKANKKNIERKININKKSHNKNIHSSKNPKKDKGDNIDKMVLKYKSYLKNTDVDTVKPVKKTKWYSE